MAFVAGEDVWLTDLGTGVAAPITRASDGSAADGASTAPVISGDGATVAFVSAADNLTSDPPTLSDDLYLHDTSTGIITQLATDADEPSITTDAATVAFRSGSSVDIVDTSTLTRRTVVVGPAEHPVLSDDGTILATIEDGQVARHDLVTGEVLVVSVPLDATPADGSARQASLDRTGDRLVYTSTATNLVAGDTNASDDVFLAIAGTGPTDTDGDGIPDDEDPHPTEVDVVGSTEGELQRAIDRSLPGDTIHIDGRHAGRLTIRHDLDPVRIREAGRHRGRGCRQHDHGRRPGHGDHREPHRDGHPWRAG